MLRPALILALLAVLAAPAGRAGAATISKVNATTLRYDATPGIRDLVDVTLEATKVRFDTINGSDTMSSVGCDAPVSGAVSAATAPGSRA